MNNRTFEISKLSFSYDDGASFRFRGQNTGIIYQRPHFIQWLTAAENLQIKR